jgi:ATP-dependent protease HslVU (ClpYQ) ATPase subunit
MSPSLEEKADRILKALTAPTPRPVLLVGESGVGKTALLRRVAATLSRSEWTVFEASATQLNSGMMFVGSLEKRLVELPAPTVGQAAHGVVRARLPSAALQRSSQRVAHRRARAAHAGVRERRHPRAR